MEALASGTGIEGTLTLPGGFPAEGAQVSIGWRSSPDGSRDKQRQPIIETRSDALGSYAICGLPARSVAVLHIVYRAREWVIPDIATPLTGILRKDFRLVLPPGESLGDLPAQAPARGALAGHVYDAAGSPLRGVSIALPGTEVGVITGEDGSFLLGDLPTGSYSLTARALGYQPAEASLSVQGGDTVRADLVLSAVKAVLTPVVTEAGPTSFERTSGFTERRKRGNGIFFDRAEIERRGALRVSELLRGVPGFTLQPVSGRWGQTYDLRMDRVSTGSRPCPIDYYVNGNEYTPSSAGIDHDFPPGQLEAMEVYRPSETPAQFSGGHARCGVVVLWTRYRANDIH